MSLVRIVERDRRDVLGEGPLWSARENALYWTDILSRRLNRLSLGTGAISAWVFDDYLGWAIERERGGFVIGLGRRVLRFNPETGATRLLANPEPDRVENRINDAKADAQGRIWAGTMSINCSDPTGSFYRLDTDGTVTRVDGPYTIANGPAIAADGSFLLHTDTALATIFRFDINDDGSLGPRTPFIAFQPEWGNPDGMTFDAEGCLWVGCWGAGCVTRFSPEGERMRSIALPASQITSCTFAGEALDRMFVTSAGDGVDEPHGGALFEVDPGCRGLATQLYRG
ncbi:SMP-30/gluconolactonase/LRE family protein [Sphingomonas sp. NIBR02145]|uniref:SMP-30/gluconolactonase/LRE family protein n=1 Tax=Sphingomonas sp. NIBR02145 TaxID=3014784 RepID=UPI0022B4CAF7|nr:SMP-30/gluconolactonase/LRE family protein [Sphingomonas sp. NIBR02145]WHU03171.1 SMP-30/gluconolactonase/LRE family protein [Sphingomonas sp. NIBR02145]